MTNIDVADVTPKLIKFLEDWFNQFSKESKAVIGISGGKDSTVAAALLVKAISKERVVGVLMPNGIQSDISDSIRVCEMLGIESITINILDPYKALQETLKASGVNHTKQQDMNLAPRIRMTTLYAIAQSFDIPTFVVNTCNRSEDYVGYSTKYGDAAGDIAVLQDFLVSDVRAIGDYLGLPKELVYKTPSDGLCGKTDEDNLGFTYDDLDKYIIWKESETKSESKCPIDKDTARLIERKYHANLHKLRPMPSFMKP